MMEELGISMSHIVRHFVFTFLLTHIYLLLAVYVTQVDEEFEFITDAITRQGYLDTFGSCSGQSCPYALSGLLQWIQNNMNFIDFQWDHFAYISG